MGTNRLFRRDVCSALRPSADFPLSQNQELWTAGKVKQYVDLLAFLSARRVPPFGIAARNPSTPDETQSLEERKNTLLVELIFEEKRYLHLARFNYYAAQGLLWASLAASSLAALLGLVPSLSAAIENIHDPVALHRYQKMGQQTLAFAAAAALEVRLARARTHLELFSLLTLRAKKASTDEAPSSVLRRTRSIN